MSSPDPQLDAKLRAVPLPDGFLDRLRAAILAEDDDLDEALRDVATPEGLLGRLKTAPAVDDEGLDEVLRDVPVPGGLSRFWRHRAQRQSWLMRMSRLALAVSIVIGLTVAYFGAMIMSLAVSHGPAPQTPQTAHVSKPAASQSAAPESLTQSWGSEVAPDALDWTPRAAPPAVVLDSAGADRDRRSVAQGDQSAGHRSSGDVASNLNLPRGVDPLLAASVGLSGVIAAGTPGAVSRSIPLG